MKPGTETGSLTNHLYSRAVIGQPEPVVGMGATVLCWTDRHAATVIKVWKHPKTGQTLIIVQEDTAQRADMNGMSESQEYTYSPNPNGIQHVYLRGPTGMWVNMEPGKRAGTWKRADGAGLRIGDRDHYHDFSL